MRAEGGGMRERAMRTVIRNGTVVTAGEMVRADVVIEGGKIVALEATDGDRFGAAKTAAARDDKGPRAQGRDRFGAAGADAPRDDKAPRDDRERAGDDNVEVIDASGMLVMPGGVDPHVHLHYPQGPNRVVSSDDWLTGTVAAACGGTTTVMDFVEARPEETWMEAFEKRLADAGANAVIDFGFHMSFNRADPQSVAEVPAVLDTGMTSFKIYMAYDGIRLTDDEMLTALEALREYGGLAIVHAENHAVIGHEVAKQLARGHTEARWHPFTRPVAGEAEATERALALAEIVGVPMHIVHVTAARGLDALRRAQRRGLDMTGEVCTQHLILTDARYAQDGPAAADYVMAPPLRTAADNEAMWRGLQDGSLGFVVTDHCPFTRAQRSGARRTPEFRKRPGQTARGGAEAATGEEEPWSRETPSFNRLPGGAPGIETRMMLTWHLGVNAGLLTPSKFVAVTSTNAAKRYGLYPRKGTLAPGADADVVVWDPKRGVTITADGLHQNVDYTPYEGMTVRGWPEMVLARGEVLVRGGEWRAIAGGGRGEFVTGRRGEREGVRW